MVEHRPVDRPPAGNAEERRRADLGIQARVTQTEAKSLIASGKVTPELAQQLQTVLKQ